jgi:hypothetical protein
MRSSQCGNVVVMRIVIDRHMDMTAEMLVGNVPIQRAVGRLSKTPNRSLRHRTSLFSSLFVTLKRYRNDGYPQKRCKRKGLYRLFTARAAMASNMLLKM